MSSVTNWNNKTEVQKGNLGERIMWPLIMKLDVIPYRPVFDDAHPVDIFMVSRDMGHIAIADSKSKARRTAYKDTGINIGNYQKYMQVAEKYHLDDIILYFVDEAYCLVYGNTIKELNKSRTITYNGKSKEYPIEEGNIRFWPIEIMVPLYELTEEECQELKNKSTRNIEWPYPKDCDKYHDFSQNPIILFGNLKLESIFNKTEPTQNQPDLFGSA